MRKSSTCLGGALAALLLVSCAPGKAGTDPTGAADPVDMAGGGVGGGGMQPGDGNAPPQMCPAGNTGPGQAPNGTVPGALAFPFPTLRNLTVVWDITGDANANGVVELRYRKAGEAVWYKAMPLKRVPAGTLAGFSWGDRHAGSIFDVEPDTTYEVEAFLLDPDGGCEVRSGTVKTRPIPAPMAGAPVRAVTPSTFATAAGSAKPGDILELAAGTYAGFSFARDGEPGKPIVLRANGAVTITGDVSFIDRKYVQLSGVTVTGRVRLNNTVEAVVTKCTVKTSSDGIVSDVRSENAYIADNVVTGATVWAESSLGVNGSSVGEGIKVTGPGHVVEHNKVSGFQDCLSLLEESEAVDQFSVDFVENDASLCADDGIEADFCFHDCRVVRNRFTNVFMAMSSQPGLGGPTYFIRNVAYNVVLSPFKLQRGSIGDVLLHNTIVKNGDAFAIYDETPISRQLSRNNLFVGGPGGTYNGYSNGSGRVMALQPADASGDYDFDAFGSTASGFTGQVGNVSFASVAEMQSKTSEKNGVRVMLDLFASTIAYPASPFPAKAVPDLRPKAGVPSGQAIANINSGSAAAVGAYEPGAALPVYGPR